MNESQAQTIVDNLTDRQKQDLQTYLMRDRDYLWIAKRLKISAIAVRNFDILTNKRYFTSEDGYGRANLRSFIISRRYIDSDWPAMDDEAIAKARSDYDAGTIEVVTARDGFHQILYRIPRKVRDVKRKPYFIKATEEEEHAPIP